MLNEFVDKFKDIEVGQKIRIRSSVPYRNIPARFLSWLSRYDNQFTVEAIQEYDVASAALITVEEVPNEPLEYCQVEPIRPKRSKVFNWHRSKS